MRSAVYKKYCILKDRTDFLFRREKLKECKEALREETEFRNKYFAKEDWLQLIKDAGSGRARYEYTRMMNERFPETKDEK